MVGAGVRPRGTALLLELLAAANHRPALKAELGAFARDVRRHAAGRAGDPARASTASTARCSRRRSSPPRSRASRSVRSRTASRATTPPPTRRSLPWDASSTSSRRAPPPVTSGQRRWSARAAMSAHTAVMSTGSSQVPPAQLAVGAVDVEREPLGFVPPGVGAELDLLRRLERCAAGLEVRPGLLEHVAQVASAWRAGRRRWPSGPCPGTTVSHPRPASVSRAAIHWAAVPSQPMGVHWLNSRSPVNTTPTSGRCTATSPAVWAGPSDRRRASWPPMSRVAPSSSISVVGGQISTPEKSYCRQRLARSPGGAAGASRGRPWTAAGAGPGPPGT